MQKHLILIIDDNQQNLQILQLMLEKADYRVNSCSSAVDAIHYLRDTLPEIILLDISMPDMDGYELCSMLKKNPSLKEIPVVFVTGLANEDNIVKAFDTGAADYITKPFKMAELLARVKLQLELKKTKEKLEEAKLKSEEKAASKDKFISVISHDLRGPFQGILGLSGMLRNEYEHLNEEEKHHFIDIIDSSLNGVYKLIENLLSWSLIEDGKFKLYPEKINVRQIVEDQLNLYRITIKEKEIIVHNAIPEGLQMLADHNGLSTVLRNIISNAVKFTPRGGCIKISSSVDKNNQLTIFVKDSGTGLDESIINDLTMSKEMRLKTMPGTNSERGSGIGLILCRELIYLMGGVIKVNVEKGKSTEFIISMGMINSNFQ